MHHNASLLDLHPILAGRSSGVHEGRGALSHLARLRPGGPAGCVLHFTGAGAPGLAVNTVVLVGLTAGSALAAGA